MPSNYQAMAAPLSSRADPLASMPIQNGYEADPGYLDANGISNVLVPRDEYLALRRAFAEYNALKSTLIEGGVTAENLQILVKSGLAKQQESENGNGAFVSQPPPQTYQQPAADQGVHSGIFCPPTKTTVRMSRPEEPTTGKPSHGNGFSSVSSPKQSPPSPVEASNGGNHNNCFTQDVTKSRRTLFFTGVPKDATYSDLVDVVCGGALIDVWMKNSDRCASVSFVAPEDADAFFRYAKRNDIYIKGRRVDVKWRDQKRQFVILRNVLRQIHHDGASRILVLRNIPHTLTEERLREDLDHIANLRVEKMIRIDGGRGIQCNLNSICAALFARTCLRSRAYYKVCKIEFGTDECAKPLPDIKEYHQQTRQKPNLPQRRGNRFDALFAEDGGEEHGLESDDDTGSISTFTRDDDETSIGESSWAESAITQSNAGTEFW